MTFGTPEGPHSPRLLVAVPTVIARPSTGGVPNQSSYCGRLLLQCLTDDQRRVRMRDKGVRSLGRFVRFLT